MEKFESVSNGEEGYSEWDSLATWADEVENKKAQKKEAIDSYKAASEGFKMDFEERATGPEQFDEWLRSGEDGISEEEIEYEGQTIKVYHLTGHSFLGLVHCINYRNNADKIVRPEVWAKSHAIQEDPNNWTAIATENNPENVNSSGPATGQANNISTSLVSDKVPNGHWVDSKKAIYYGFTDLGHRGIITARPHDAHTQEGWTSNVDSEDFHIVTSSETPGWTDDARKEALGDWRAINTIDEIEARPGANEVAIDRYEEDNGRPILPNFIYCPELPNDSADDLTDDQKRHAAFFGIPIVILHQDAYTL